MIQYAPAESLDAFVEADSSRSEHGSIGRLFAGKVSCLVDILSAIDSDASARMKLSGSVLVEIERQYCYLKTKLYELDTWGIGVNRNVESRRSKLEMQLDKLNQETRQERVQAWKDVEDLRKESRIWFKQYSDLVQRLRIVGVNFKNQPVSSPEMLTIRRGGRNR